MKKNHLKRRRGWYREVNERGEHSLILLLWGRYKGMKIFY